MDTVVSKRGVPTSRGDLLRNVILDVEEAALVIPSLQDERRRIISEMATANEAVEMARERLDVIDQRLDAAWAMLRTQEALYRQVREVSEIPQGF